jgi:hypothetical protein
VTSDYCLIRFEMFASPNDGTLTTKVLWLSECLWLYSITAQRGLYSDLVRTKIQIKILQKYYKLYGICTGKTSSA